MHVSGSLRLSLPPLPPIFGSTNFQLPHTAEPQSVSPQPGGMTRSAWVPLPCRFQKVSPGRNLEQLQGSSPSSPFSQRIRVQSCSYPGPAFKSWQQEDKPRRKNLVLFFYSIFCLSHLLTQIDTHSVPCRIGLVPYKVGLFVVLRNSVIL